MARASLAVQTVSAVGAALTYTAAAVDGHAFDNVSGSVMVHVKNDSGSPVTVTFETPNLVDTDLAVPDRTVSVPAGEDRIIGPFSKSVYNQALTTPAITSGVTIDTSAQTSVTYAAFKA